MTSKLFVAVSGGADSSAMALLLHERGVEFEMVFADTGAELPEVYWLLPRLAQQVGRPLHVVSGGSFFQHLMAYGFLLPSAQRRWCTRVLKNGPQDRFYASVGAEAVAIGIRADEWWRTNEEPRPQSGLKAVTYPLIQAGLGKKDVHALCARHELVMPVYEWRTNVSCFCCFFQRKYDWLGLLCHHPTLYAVAEEWEQQSVRRTTCGFTWNEAFTLTALRTADENQLRLWPDETEEQPCLICTA